ncbi:hypothetical protein A1D31_24120 [Bradyrhizobium liaoningense]|nr:hypothetical protein A1D31_24120 [Bradyrhizobium liaoningense]
MTDGLASVPYQLNLIISKKALVLPSSALVLSIFVRQVLRDASSLVILPTIAALVSIAMMTCGTKERRQNISCA